MSDANQLENTLAREALDALTAGKPEGDDGGNDLIEAYFGSCLVINTKTHESVLVNLLIPCVTCHAEATGEAYLMMRDDYPSGDGWVITLLDIEEFTVSVNPYDVMERNKDVTA